MMQGQAPADYRDAVAHRLEGTFIYGGCVYGHFGHLLLETFARLAAILDSDLPILFSSLNHTRNALFWNFIEAVDLPADRITVIDAPAIVKTLHVPAPDFRIRAGINLPFVRAYETLGDRVAARLDLRQNSNPKPGYLSRSRTPRTGRYYFGETLIEAALVERGCNILHMETMRIERQIAEVLTRSHLLGFVGTAFHHVLFSRARKTTSYLTTAGVNANFRLIEALKGNATQDVTLHTSEGGSIHPLNGPFLLSRDGIAQAVRAAGFDYTSKDIPIGPYADCVDAFAETRAQMRAADPAR